MTDLASSFFFCLGDAWSISAIDDSACWPDHLRSRCVCISASDIVVNERLVVILILFWFRFMWALPTHSILVTGQRSILIDNTLIRTRILLIAVITCETQSSQWLVRRATRAIDSPLLARAAGIIMTSFLHSISVGQFCKVNVCAHKCDSHDHVVFWSAHRSLSRNSYRSPRALDQGSDGHSYSSHRYPCATEVLSIFYRQLLQKPWTGVLLTSGTSVQTPITKFFLCHYTPN